MEPSGLPKIARHVPDPSGTFHNIPDLPNLPYMPETIPDTPGTIPDTSGIIRDLSEPFRDHPRHSRNPSLLSSYSKPFRYSPKPFLPSRNHSDTSRNHSDDHRNYSDDAPINSPISRNYPKRHPTLSVSPDGSETCRHDRDTSPINDHQRDLDTHNEPYTLHDIT